MSTEKSSDASPEEICLQRELIHLLTWFRTLGVHFSHKTPMVRMSRRRPRKESPYNTLYRFANWTSIGVSHTKAPGICSVGQRLLLLVLLRETPFSAESPSFVSGELLLERSHFCGARPHLLFLFVSDHVRGFYFPFVASFTSLVFRVVKSLQKRPLNGSLFQISRRERKRRDAGTKNA